MSDILFILTSLNVVGATSNMWQQQRTCKTPQYLLEDDEDQEVHVKSSDLLDTYWATREQSAVDCPRFA